MDIESEVIEIQKRNARVELDKAWETSLFRKASIALVTYAVIVIFLQVANTQSPFVAALVPMIGYLISTLTLPFVKKWWLASKK